MIEVSNSSSFYDSLCRGELKGTDLRLVFEERHDSVLPLEITDYDDDDTCHQSSSGTADISTIVIQRSPFSSRRTCREVHVHRYLFEHTSGLIRAAMAHDRFVEAQNGVVRLVVPANTLSAVDHLLRWHYDHKLQFQDLNETADILPRLWKLADFLQCNHLCEHVTEFLRQGKLQTAESFARFIELGVALFAEPLIQAALNAVDGHFEDMLDHGGKELLGSLSVCRTILERIRGNYKSIEQILGCFLAEMDERDRNEIPPLAFVRCLAYLPIGTINEFDFANMVLSYVESNRMELERSVQNALFYSIDFRAISRDALVFTLLPRVMLISPWSAVSVSAAVKTASALQMRCAYSAERFWDRRYNLGQNPYGSIFELPCCKKLICYRSYIALKRGTTGEDVLRCPSCFGGLSYKIPPSLVNSLDCHEGAYARLTSYFETKRMWQNWIMDARNNYGDDRAVDPTFLCKWTPTSIECANLLIVNNYGSLFGRVHE